MTREEAIWYLQPIADSASLPRYAEALGMAIAALREQPRWISVEERLPDKKGEYLTYDQWGYGAVIKTAYWTPKYDGFDEYLRGRAIWHNYDSEYGCYELTGITHWMPLPSTEGLE